MQLQNIALIIIAIIISSGVSYALFIIARYAITSDHARHYNDGKALGVQQGRAEVGGLLVTDLQTLADITNTLRLAHSTWLPIIGTEPHRARVVAQLKALNSIAARIRSEIQPEHATPSAAPAPSASGEAA